MAQIVKTNTAKTCVTESGVVDPVHDVAVVVCLPLLRDKDQPLIHVLVASLQLFLRLRTLVLSEGHQTRRSQIDRSP